MRMADMKLVDDKGQRLFLNAAERKTFQHGALAFPAEVKTFCHTLLYTGCQLSEALELTTDQVHFDDETLTFRTLKKRGRVLYRQVPVPPVLLEALDLVYHLRDRRQPKPGPLWTWERTTAWRKVKQVMRASGIEGLHATTKGLRHGFGVACVEKQIALNLIQKWMGHADLGTTVVYASVLDEDEHSMAARLWE